MICLLLQVLQNYIVLHRLVNQNIEKKVGSIFIFGHFKNVHFSKPSMYFLKKVILHDHAVKHDFLLKKWLHKN